MAKCRRLLSRPSHCVPSELVMMTTFGTSQGPRHPLTERCTRFKRPRTFHSCLSHCTGTSGYPFSFFPQQHPSQMLIWASICRFGVITSDCDISVSILSVNDIAFSLYITG